MSATVWDISVAGVHNFYVAADDSSVPVLVHNAADACGEPLLLEDFVEILDFLDESSVEVSEGLSEVFADAFASAVDRNVGRGEYERVLSRIARLADEHPDVLRELAVRPDWVNSAGLAGASRFDELVTAATTNRFVRDLEPDAVTNLGSLGGTEFREAVGILDDLGVVDQELVDAVLLQSDFLGGVRQLVPGAEPRLVTINGVPHALDVTGVRHRIQPGPPARSIRLPNGVTVSVTPNGFVAFPQSSGTQRISFAAVQIGPREIANPGDFRAANAVMRERIELFKDGRLTDPAQIAEVESLPTELVDWFLTRAQQTSPNVLNGAGANYTWHHSEITGRLELVDFETHDLVGHLGGSSVWGETVSSRIR